MTKRTINSYFVAGVLAAVLGLSTADAQTIPPPSVPGVVSGAVTTKTSTILALGTVTGGSGYTSGTNILTLGAITAGSAYTPGFYAATALTGGTGTGATANITVDPTGVVITVTLASKGTGYTAGDTLSATLPAGSGFSIPVSTIGLVTTNVPLTGGTGSGALATVTITAAGAVSAASISNGGSGYTAGDTLSASLAGGSGFSVPVSTIQDVITVASGVSDLKGHLFVDKSAVMTGAQSATQSAIFWHNTITGNCSSGGTFCGAGLELVATNFAATGSAGSVPTVSYVKGALGGVAHVGGAIVSQFSLQVTAATGNLAVGNEYQAGGFTAQADVNDNGSSGANSGDLYGLSIDALLTPKATFWNGERGLEIGLQTQAGASVHEVIGSAIVLRPSNASAGDLQNSGYTVSAGSGATATMTCAFCVGAYDGFSPLATTATIMGFIQHSASSVIPGVANGIDFVTGGWTFTGKAFQSPGFSVDATGNIVGLQVTGQASGAGGVVDGVFRNNNAGTLGASILEIGNSTAQGQVKMTLNGGGFSGGLGANAFSITNNGSSLINIGGSSEPLRFNSSGMWAANATTATALTSVGPTGSHTTVQTWFTVVDNTGTTRWIPGF